MNLYLIKRQQASYDEALGMVIAAPNEFECRRIACMESLDEGIQEWFENTTTCTLIGTASEELSTASLILRS